MAIDFQGPAWREIEAWAQGELATARTRNDGVDLDPNGTALIRGEIKFIKKLLGLPNKAAREQQGGSAAAHPYE